MVASMEMQPGELGTAFQRYETLKRILVQMNRRLQAEVATVLHQTQAAQQALIMILEAQTD
jgi:hypothetical protein